MRVICCIIELYVVFIRVPKKRSFNGHKDNGYFLNVQNV